MAIPTASTPSPAGNLYTQNHPQQNIMGLVPPTQSNPQTTGPQPPPQIPNSPATTTALNGVPWAPSAGQQSTQIGAGPVITQGQQAAAFVNPYTNTEQNQINNMPTNLNANQIGTTPLSGITTLGNKFSNALGAGQATNINQLNNLANGVGPSSADLAAEAAREQNVANAYAMTGAQRGSSNPALGLRSAQEAKANADQNAAFNQVQGKTAEQLAATQQLTGALGTAQGQQMQNTQTQGAMNQQVNLANQQAQLNTYIANLQAKQQTQGLDANEYNALVQAQAALANTNMSGAMNFANLATGENTSRYGIDQGVAVNNTNNQMGLIGAGIAGGAGLAGAGVTALAPSPTTSDRRLKSNIKKADRSVKAFLSQIQLPQPKFALLT